LSQPPKPPQGALAGVRAISPLWCCLNRGAAGCWTARAKPGGRSIASGNLSQRRSADGSGTGGAGPFPGLADAARRLRPGLHAVALPGSGKKRQRGCLAALRKPRRPYRKPGGGCKNTENLAGFILTFSEQLFYRYITYEGGSGEAGMQGGQPRGQAAGQSQYTLGQTSLERHRALLRLGRIGWPLLELAQRSYAGLAGGRFCPQKASKIDVFFPYFSVLFRLVPRRKVRQATGWQEVTCESAGFLAPPGNLVLNTSSAHGLGAIGGGRKAVVLDGIWRIMFIFRGETPCCGAKA
jgi:hypothetical protein